MNEKEELLPENMLTAEQLVQSKGIQCNALKEWEESRKILPKFGQKQFEPNNSWLEKVQIEKGIKNCRDLLSIERVERLSQLATAEWLPEKRKAQVIKKSGQDWGNFGMEINNILYLIPEEALLLLEMNCLELMWNDMPLSIQQAYEILIDNTDCTLEEYRVYSQLTRYGYHIQRFYYGSAIKDAVSDETVSLKRKVIVEPEKGLRMRDSEQRVTHDTNNQFQVSNKIKSDLSEQETHINTSTNMSEKFFDNTIEEEVKMIIENIIHIIENTNNSTSEVVEKDDCNKNNHKSKIEIIFEETVHTDIKIVKKPIICSTKGSAPAPKWLDSRIQRNVKLLPKRTEKLSTAHNKIESTNKCLEQNSFNKRKEPLICEKEQEKKSKLEVIELSDDEIQIVPHTLTRMEMLDLLPNIASQSVIIQKMSQNYIPPTIKPHKDIYRYERKRLQYLSEINSKRHCKYSNRNFKEIPYSSNAYLQAGGKVDQRNNYPPLYPLYPLYTPNINVCRIPFCHHMYCHNKGGIVRENLYRNSPHAFPFGYAGHLGYFGTTMQRNRSVDAGAKITRNGRNEYQSSFKVLPDVASWKELKQKWHDEKTITIDDEDCASKEIPESTEVEILKEHIPPLVGPNNMTSLAEVYNKLRIIKNAPEKTVRRRRGEFKISYNIYSNTQHYRKGNPGEPLYRLVVIRQKESPFFQPVELNRLQQDAKGTAIMFAIVSMSISYIRPGIVSIPLLS